MSAPWADGNPTAPPTHAAAGASRPHLRDPGHLALRRAGEVRADAQEVRTPLGEAETDVPLVDWLADARRQAVEMEDYCHSFEHTVELEVVFLQHVLGPGVRILPVLCGSVRAQPVPGRQSRRRRWRQALPGRAGRTGRARRQPPLLGPGSGHGPHGRALPGLLRGGRGAGPDEKKWAAATKAGSPASTPATRRVSGTWCAQQPRRSQVVRLRALLHLPESRSPGPRRSCCATSNGTSTSAAW